ncbi:bifunctional glycosyltransferase family 2/GtrA family protein [Arthrobacter agilis]|uniref:bifunctional glycosyltransferase family 2/GtrA family protein n=1 Tax=Arthrobacter agilis TaxID=37921 RepID=UPI00236687E0|nr:bifunctional glycosyltransferase family 2/GtrA family protein [Arthrobacter agilis]WDF33300.1 bifunctional glycosyltransferase family 2/GtrA family protein [Arthrobacter agilis]
MIILIPAFEPDAALPDLVRDLFAADPRLVVLVVDDGSGPRFAAVFETARRSGATVIGYPHNRGKGQALKTGFGYAERHHPGEAVVCADSDGQHAVPDILRVAARVLGISGVVGGSSGSGGPGGCGACGGGGDPQDECRDDRHASGPAMVLGERTFDGEVPVRSRLGNALTRTLFRYSAGVRLHDTQTGLRGYPAALLPWLRSVRGDRYEYELNLLLHAGQAGYRIDSVEISTIYLAGNSSSHFRPLVDSARIYAPLLRFSLSSLAAFGIDLAAFVVLGFLTESLLLTVVGARLISSFINFLSNRSLVFPDGRHRPLLPAASRYFGLVVALLAANYAAILVLTVAGMPDVPAKVLTEILLFAVSFTAQQRFLSGRGKGHPGTAHMRGSGPAQPRHRLRVDRRERTTAHLLENTP